MATAQSAPHVQTRLPSRPRWRWLRQLRRSPVGLFGAILVVLVLVAAVAAPVLSPHDPTKQNLKSRMLPPAWHEEGNITYPLGTDQLGRDLLSRLIYGARVSVVVGVLGVVVSAIVGVALGLLSGFLGGWLDVLISRTVDTFMAIPFILLALAVVGALGLGEGAGIITLVIVLGLTGWVTFARVIRGEVLSIREREYVIATRSIGQRPMRILFRHILPNVTASIIVLSTLQISTVILAESSLSFLGLGIQPPTISWGVMLAEGRDHLATSWWLATFPGIAISLTVLGTILLGDWLRDVLDPRMKK